MNKINAFGVNFDNLDMEQTVAKIDQLILDQKKGYIVTPNVDHIVKLRNDLAFQETYKNAILVVNDSMIIYRSLKLVGYDPKTKVSGSDLFPRLCKQADIKGYKVIFAGATNGIAQKAADKLTEKYPNLNVCNVIEPSMGFEKDPKEINRIINEINLHKPDLLFLGVGTPKQEKFIYNYFNEIDAKITVCIGGSFAFEAGDIPRAPKWIQNIGLEWLHRFSREPKRLFKRYFIDDTKFLLMVLKERKSKKD